MFTLDRPELGARLLLVVLDRNDRDVAGKAAELSELVRSAAGEIVGSLQWKLQRPSASTLISKGKLEMLAEQVRALDAQAVVISEDLTPSQERNLERQLGVRVISRSELILVIFAQRARSSEGMLQVELARLRHMATRLVRGWSHLDRQKGGVGMRGAGETQLEMDQRLVGARIRQTEAQLEKVGKRRAQVRRSRARNDAATVALVGYTNAGKSTLFNSLTQAGVRSEDLLFATLDPTMRRLRLSGVGDVVLADTVGFIADLPHRLVEAFKATLEEVAQARLLIHVIDAASPYRDQQIKEVDAVLEEIGAGDVPQIKAMNKIDLLPNEDVGNGRGGCAWVSARTGQGIDQLLALLAAQLQQERTQLSVSVPPSQGRLRAWLYEQGSVLSEAVGQDGYCVLEVFLSDEQRAHVQRALGVAV